MSKYQVKWGILATGGIAETFTRDLLVNPETRGVKDLEHLVVAAASSSSVDRAAEFLKKVGAPSSARPYGSYKELVADSDVDIIYIATPHSHHYQNARLCLEFDKHVLCEKAFTTNAKQAKILVEIARKRSLFLMEAVWTRYFPLSIYVRDVVTSGRIGTVHRAQADNSMSMNPEEKLADSHRLLNMDLAGGALLDLGIYSLTWLFQTLYLTQDPKDRKPPKVMGAMNKYATTGADALTSMLLVFPRSEEHGGDMHGIATTGMRTAANPDGKGTAGPAIRIQGDKGEVQVWHPAFRPTKTRLVLTDGSVEDREWKQPGPGPGSKWYNGFGSSYNDEGEGHGMFWEADEAGHALKEGRQEGQFEGWDESIVIMEVMDEVRRQNNMVYPEKIETTDYPVQL